MKVSSRLAQFGFLLLLLQVFVLPPAQADAQSMPIYGPQTFSRMPGAARVISHAFNVPASMVAPFSLNVTIGKSKESESSISHDRNEIGEVEKESDHDPGIENERHKGLHEGSEFSRSVWIDGVEVVSPRDFSEDVEVINKPLDLSPGSHRLEVKFNRSRHGFMTVTLFGTRMAPPVPPPPTIPPPPMIPPPPTLPSCLQMVPPPPGCSQQLMPPQTIPAPPVP